MEPHRCLAVLDPDQLDVATVRLQVRPHAVEGEVRPRHDVGLDDAVQCEDRPHVRVVDQLEQQLLAAGIVAEGAHDVHERRPVERLDRRLEFQRRRSGIGIEVGHLCRLGVDGGGELVEAG